MTVRALAGPSPAISGLNTRFVVVLVNGVVVLVAVLVAAFLLLGFAFDNALVIAMAWLLRLAYLVLSLLSFPPACRHAVGLVGTREALKITIS